MRTIHPRHAVSESDELDAAAVDAEHGQRRLAVLHRTAGLLTGV